jgi:Domain of unknown function (DUF4157)
MNTYSSAHEAPRAIAVVQPARQSMPSCASPHERPRPDVDFDFAAIPIHSSADRRQANLRDNLVASFGESARRVAIEQSSTAAWRAQGLTSHGRVLLAQGNSETTSYERRVSLGHEVAHALQQDRGAGQTSKLDRSDRMRLEAEAERAGHAFACGQPFSVQAARPGRARSSAALKKRPVTGRSLVRRSGSTGSGTRHRGRRTVRTLTQRLARDRGQAELDRLAIATAARARIAKRFQRV